jgi:signal transduction histidine kinase
MPESSTKPPRVRPRQSLSGRLWLLATLSILLTEVLVFLPYIAHERRSWLAERVDDASLAFVAASGDQVTPKARLDLLRVFDAAAIRLSGPNGEVQVIGDVSADPDMRVDLRREDLVMGIPRALAALLFQNGGLLAVTADSRLLPRSTLELLLHRRALSHALRQSAADFGGLALLIAGVTGGIVYLAVLVLLVRPMRRLTGSIAAFRINPESALPLDPDQVTVLPDDEIAVAGRELSAMQQELRGALWRNARLAALGTVVAKVSHDLRGILTPALLTAERLQLNPDEKVRRAGETLIQAVERATELVRRTLDYAREGPPPLVLSPIGLASLVNEAVETARPLRSPSAPMRLDNRVELSLLVNCDRTQLFRVLANLLRNAAEAGARRVRVSAQLENATVIVEIADNGPGLPEPVRAELFRPFASMRRGGSGLGLAIARDLMVAHGGSIELVETSAAGTTFRLTLRAADTPAPAQAQQGADRVASATSANV